MKTTCFKCGIGVDNAKGKILILWSFYKDSSFMSGAFSFEIWSELKKQNKTLMWFFKMHWH